MKNTISGTHVSIGLLLATLFIVAGFSVTPSFASANSWTAVSATPSYSSSGSSGSTPSSSSYSSGSSNSSSGSSGSTWTAVSATPSYQPSNTSATDDGGDYDVGCCDSTGHTWTAISATPSYSYTPPSSGCTTNCGGGGGGCNSNCGGGGCTHNCTPPPPPPAPTCTLSANRTSINPGQDVTLTWTSHNAVSGTLSNYGAISLNSWINLFPQHNTTYAATFTSQDGRTVTCTTTVTVTPPQQCPSGYTGTYPNCVPPPVAPSCTIYVNNYNQNYNQNYNNQYGNYGQPVVINWNSQNAISGWINQNVGSVTLSGNRTVYPTQTTVYTATFVGQNNQTVTCSVTVNVNTYIPPVYQNPVPYVTLAAVPYTGLDLGPVGTTIYWGFLIAWCVLAAYLIAVKRVHMKIARWYNKALFGEETIVHTSHAVPIAHASHKVAAPVIELEGVDSFIISQIHRGNRA